MFQRLRNPVRRTKLCDDRAHCNAANNGSSDYVDRNDDGDANPPPTSQWYGNTVAISPWVGSLQNQEAPAYWATTAIAGCSTTGTPPRRTPSWWRRSIRTSTTWSAPKAGTRASTAMQSHRPGLVGGCLGPILSIPASSRPRENRGYPRRQRRPGHDDRRLVLVNAAGMIQADMRPGRAPSAGRFTTREATGAVPRLLRAVLQRTE